MCSVGEIYSFLFNQKYFGKFDHIIKNNGGIELETIIPTTTMYIGSNKYTTPILSNAEYIITFNICNFNDKYLNKFSVFGYSDTFIEYFKKYLEKNGFDRKIINLLEIKLIYND